ncbi:MAG: hypothetical protein E7028_02680 [Planctomycetaceae bacterium]|nr:hypothetical protein [Planctomycetaceae bacterium]MBQ2822800.1 hypothetical protein [Thermoguttaceae bacterium]
MPRTLLGWTLLLCCCLTGCVENQDNLENTEEQTLPEVTARFCHIARIGSLAEMPENVWDALSVSGKENAEPSSKETESSKKSTPEKSSKNSQNEDDLAANHSLSHGLLSLSASSAVGEEVSDDFLKIVQEAAKETTTDSGIRQSSQKKEELDLVVEMVEEDQEQEEAIRKAAQEREKSDTPKNSKPANLLRDSDGKKKKNEPENDSMNEELGIEIIEEEELSDEAENFEDTDSSTTGSDADESEESSIDSGSNADLSDDSDADADSETNVGENSAKVDAQKLDQLNAQAVLRMEDELERQAEEFLEILKNVPEEVRKELHEHHFRNLSFRMIRIPGSILSGKTISEYYVIRSMDYVGSNLSEDFQHLAHSPEYTRWMSEMGQFLDIMTLDKSTHDIWLEAPEFWNSEKDSE